MMPAIPTRRDEAFRYSDVDALAAVWPVTRTLERDGFKEIAA
jgi:hypothetical protein